MTSSLLVLSANDVQHLVRTALKPDEVIRCMARVFELVSGSEIGEGASSEHDRVQQPPRLTTSSPAHATLYMPCRLPVPVTSSSELQTSPIHTAIKVVSVPRDGGESGIPGTTLVLDEYTGVARAVVNSRALTALRNAAGSVLATQLLGPAAPTRITLFGAGLQTRQHARLLAQTYPSITHCTIVNRTLNARFKELLSDLATEFPKLRVEGLASSSTPTPDVEAAVRAADVICTATSSTQPLFKSEWVKSGTHVNLVGSYKPTMREVDVDLIKRAGRRVIVDEAKSCLVEAGEIVDAELGEEDLVEIGILARAGADEVIAKVKKSGDVTIFKSVGVGAQNVGIASLMVELAEKDGNVGTRIPYD